MDGELDPEDDPNNQGEDEFEEAEDEQPQHRATEEEEEAVEEEEEPAVPAQHRNTHVGPEQPAVDEELVVSEGGAEDMEKEAEFKNPHNRKGKCWSGKNLRVWDGRERNGMIKLLQ